MSSTPIRENNVDGQQKPRPNGSQLSIQIDPSQEGKDSPATETQFFLKCIDEGEERTKTFAFPTNPFSPQTPPKGPTSQILRVFLQAKGTGSSSNWRRGLGEPYNKGAKRSKARRKIEISLPLEGRVTSANESSGSDSDSQEEAPARVVDEYGLGGWQDVKDEFKDSTLLGTFRPSFLRVERIEIISKPLLKLLQSVIEFYPGYILKGEELVVRAPFAILAHYYRELVELRDSVRKQGGGPTECADKTEKPDHILLDTATLHDLDVLLAYFGTLYETSFAKREALHKSGLTRFDWLWFLFKPGDMVYGKIGGQLSGYVYEKYKEVKRPDFRRVQLLCWCLKYTGRRISWEGCMFEIDDYEFDGEKEIQSLIAFPSMYLDSKDSHETRDRLQRRGEKYFNIVRDIPAHRQYRGECWDMEKLGEEVFSRETKRMRRKRRHRPDSEYCGEIVIDNLRRRDPQRRMIAMSSTGTQEDIESELDDDDEPDPEPEPSGICPALKTKTRAQLFHPLIPQNHSQLTADHYFLLPRRLNGFALALKHKMSFDVDKIQPIDWPPEDSDPMNDLILAEDDKDVIKALTSTFCKSEKKWAADFIKGKGEGQIFLLHGSPGTGKTFTVECVSKYTKRPLIRLTVADIGTNEREMEDVLGEWFRRGTDWGAIILIDEADVFLEKRQVKDLQRNSLVSVFLSCMEYYSGMLFLTTNRVGHIDDAFLSRISVAVTYPDLVAEKQKKIWHGFLKKLELERGDIILEDRAKRYWEKLAMENSTKNAGWNGRDIRNALQTAIAIAMYEAEREARKTKAAVEIIFVRQWHLEAVVERKKNFDRYRNDIDNDDVATRAFNEGARALPSRKA